MAPKGFTYLAVLLAVAVVGLGAAALGQAWAAKARSERLAELDWVGSQYVDAIASYYEAAPFGRMKTYPRALEDLLLDSRYPFVRRHLRTSYPNPLTGRMDWLLVRAPDGGIRGLTAVVPDGFPARIAPLSYTFTTPQTAGAAKP